MEERERTVSIAGCNAAHERLIAHLDELLARDVLDARAPSLLPDWTVGHVLTHLARNADSFVGVIRAATRGEVAFQYPSLESRNEAIEAGAPRPAHEQVADVRRSTDELRSAMDDADTTTWMGQWRNVFGDVPIDEIPFRRWREVEVHHADLGLRGFGWDDWSSDYVTRELHLRTMEWASRQPMGMTALPEAALALAPSTRLAWLMGRTTPPGLEPVRFP